MERHKRKPQLGFPCCIRTPKTHGCLNTLHPNPRDEFYNLLGSCGGALGMSFTTCWGRVEELLVAREQEIKHTKLIFFPCSSATTCVNRPLRVDQSFHLEYNELRFEYKIS
ncbi:hypothetical protein Taro_025200 [Colocasia esculenta]|uniref:Uncharacterized protein n=1 Tax=Colocasia esculenta TaxID=4460 RepID=A0A843VJU1_COLES|nr:hypothetical protein [Colocasia esculenta]